MSIPREIRAKRGDWILPKWRALLKFIERTSVIVKGEGVRMSYLPSGGIHVYADDNFEPWNSPFKVSVNGSTARVREGTINGVTPAIGSVRLDGIDSEGNEVERPALKIKHLGGSKSYIALRLNFSDEPVDFDREDIEAAQIVHIKDLPPLFNQGGSAVLENATLYPLAAIYWTPSKTIRRRFQITHHNLNHRFVKGELSNGKPSRHLFWAA